MIKMTTFIIEAEANGDSGRKVRASLIADTKAEVIEIGDDGETIIGLSKNDKLTLGSTCLCANCDFGVLNSEGKWTF